MEITPITLEGRHVRLEPLSLAHHPGLCEVGLDPSLWELMPVASTTPEKMLAFIENALKLQVLGKALPYATVERASGKVVGSTRFMEIDVPNRHVEIGYTWIARPWQRSAINTEAKHLMLRHAFEVWKCLRVEFKTDLLNDRSQKAILRLGAKQEGIFRNHMVTESGRIRNSIWFSIIAKEWPDVKAGLEQKMTR